MSLRRIALHTAVTAARAARLPIAPALSTAGRFDRAAIMREAVRLARSAFRSLGSWQARMSMGLRAAWRAAKAALVEGMCVTHVPSVSRPAWTPAPRVPAAIVARTWSRARNDYAR